MQIISGLISCDPGVDDSLITGNSSVDWSQVTVGSLLVVNGITYSITDVNAGAKTLRISPSWVGTAVAGVSYVIVRDFTVNMQLPLLNPGDLEAAAIFSRAMYLLDGLANVVAGDPTVSDYVITQTAHGFKVGNVLRINSGAWALATSASSTTSLAVGVVSKVVDANTFWVRTTGSVGSSLIPIFGVTLVAGQVYYLRETPSGSVNICTGADIDTGALKVPVLQAITVNTAFIMGMAQATTNVFAANKAGLVPDPGTPSGKILLDTGWGSPSGLADDSIQAKHLDPTVPWVSTYAADLDWDNFENQAASTPIHAFIMDLQRRLKVAEQTVSAGSYNVAVYTRKSHPAGTFTWAVPAGVRWAQITVFSGEARGVGTYAVTGRTGAVTYQNYQETVGNTQLYVPLGAGARFRMSLEGVTSLSGTILPYKTTLNYNSSVPVCVIGYDGNQLLTWWQSPGGSNGSPVPFSFSIPQGARPVSSPFTYALNLSRLTSPLTQYHYPERSHTDMLKGNYPDMLSVDSQAGFYYASGNFAQGHFSGVVIIETGLIV